MAFCKLTHLSHRKNENLAFDSGLFTQLRPSHCYKLCIRICWMCMYLCFRSQITVIRTVPLHSLYHWKLYRSGQLHTIGNGPLYIEHFFQIVEQHWYNTICGAQMTRVSFCSNYFDILVFFFWRDSINSTHFIAFENVNFVRYCVHSRPVFAHDVISALIIIFLHNIFYFIFILIKAMLG